MEWIRLNDQKPNDNETCLLSWRGHYHMGKWSEVENDFMCCGQVFDFDEIFWMLVPHSHQKWIKLSDQSPVHRQLCIFIWDGECEIGNWDDTMQAFQTFCWLYWCSKEEDQVWMSIPKKPKWPT